MKKILFIIALFVNVSLNYIHADGTVGVDNRSSYGNSIDFNFDWNFRLVSESDSLNASLFNAAGWRKVRLPHDWSMELGYRKESTAGSNGFLPGGIGIYYKDFSIPDSVKTSRIFIRFEAIYNRSHVWINGHHLGFSPNGYLDQEYELTDYLYHVKSNRVVVKVDRSAYADTRWYVGAGIYRNVTLISRNDIYIPTNGIGVVTPIVSEKNSKMLVTSEIVNRCAGVDEITLVHELRDNGKVLANRSSRNVLLKGNINRIEDELSVDNIVPWSIDTPKLYQLSTSVYHKGKKIDEKITEVGFRTIKFDANDGFFLNSKNIKIKGVNIHHDLGCIGVAAYDNAIYRRLKKLKQMGCNAIRTAHNPHSESLLAMCDSMGLLVMDEFIDEWKKPKDKWISKRSDKPVSKRLSSCYSDYFEADAEKDLKRFIKRDRNHPSVIIWSIGNEIEWTYPYYWASSKENKGFGGLIATDDPEKDRQAVKERFDKLSGGKDELSLTAASLVGYVKEIDTTRPVTSGVVIPNVSRVSGYTDVLDVVGYNYKDAFYETDHSLYPYQPIFGSENVGQYYEWKAVEDKAYIPGIFVWTGVDYLGENGPWPVRCGDYSFFDICGMKTPRGHFFECLWKNTPKTYIVTTPAAESEFKMLHDGSFKLVEREGWIRRWEWYDTYRRWDWKNNDSIIVQVYSNATEVELFLNNQSLGRKKRVDFSSTNVMLWMVPYSDGIIKAVGYENGTAVSCDEMRTPQNARALGIEADKTSVKSDGYELVYLEISLTDKNGTLIYDSNSLITVDTDKKIELIGIDNGSVNIPSAKDSKSISLYKGKCVAVLRAVRGCKGQSVVSVRTSSGIKRNVKIDIL